VSGARTVVPFDYPALVAELKERIHGARLRATLAANQELVLLYWDIGQVILARQAGEGWGAKVIDRLAADLRVAFPDMKGLSPRNLKYMRLFAEAWRDREIVQGVLAQIPWWSNLALLEKLDDGDRRLWYAKKALPENLRGSLPTVAELEATLEGADEGGTSEKEP
jgi:predicted nuclease of restriction endonuclease-like (RecB) superfamily